MSARSKLIPLIPTAFTLGNLVCGFVAMALATDALRASGGTGPLDPAFGHLIIRASWVIVLGMVLDSLDGRIARMTGQTSPFGAMLDSLADLVTFGLAPAFIAKVVYEHTMSELGLPFRPTLVTSLCAAYVICAALRLARFTVFTDDDDSHEIFAGLPSPAAAALIVSACFFGFEGPTELGAWLPGSFMDAAPLWTLRLLPAMAFVGGLLMVSKVPYVHVASRYVGHRMQVGAFVRLVGIIWLAVIFHEWFLFLSANIYVLGGLVIAWRARRSGHSPLDELPAPASGDDDYP